jgi:sugar (pentulose or hexulose) kinase
MIRNIAVIDIGKTNAKLALVRADGLVELDVATRPNIVRPGPPYPHYDVAGHLLFLLDALGRFHRAHGVDAISITTHGACGVLLATDGSLAAPVLDYEHDGPDETAAAYDAIRPPFAETGSPRLPHGLNLGAQIHWQFQMAPGLRDRVAHILTYPQYWGYLLTGALATDVTSLGCHTDLWLPHEAQFSALVDRLSIADKIAPARHPQDKLGTILPAIAAATGLDPATPVACGIHDSNASLLPHILLRQPPFSVLSTGTWCVAMAIGATPRALDEAKDTLINVNALGQPVPSARFMGGREFDLVMQGATTMATPVDIAAVLDADVMLLPAIVPDTGPFRGRTARWLPAAPPVGSGQRAAATAFYLALVTAHALSLIGHRGEIVVEGPFARNLPYLHMLSAATGSPVIAAEGTTGTARGAAMLIAGATGMQADTAPPVTVPDGYMAYAERWSGMVASDDAQRWPYET